MLCNKSNAKVGAGAVDWSRGESSEVDGDQLVCLEFRPLSTPPLHVLQWNKSRVCSLAAIVSNGVNFCVAMVPSGLLYVNGVWCVHGPQ